MSERVKVYIEIEKGSNIKYEFDKEQNKLLIDRILPDPFFTHMPMDLYQIP